MIQDDYTTGDDMANVKRTTERQDQRPSGMDAVKHAYATFKKNVRNRGVPLKQFVRDVLLRGNDAGLRSSAEDWFFNKTHDFSDPPLGIGKTRGKKKKASRKN